MRCNHWTCALLVQLRRKGGGLIKRIEKILQKKSQIYIEEGLKSFAAFYQRHLNLNLAKRRFLVQLLDKFRF